jgi:hypothetical protein
MIAAYARLQTILLLEDEMNTANNLIGVCALLASVPGEALAQAAYPNQPIRFVAVSYTHLRAHET